MASAPAGKHAGPGATSNKPAVAEPTYAERARTLAYLGRIGSLSTLSRKQPGFPFGSVMPYGLDGHGRPIFLVSTMAMHTQNVQADPRSSLLVTQPDATGDPLGASRVTLLGNALPVPETEVAEGAEALPGALRQQQVLGGLRGLFLLPHGRGGRLLRGRLWSDGLGFRPRNMPSRNRPSGGSCSRDHPAHEYPSRGWRSSSWPVRSLALSPRK